MKNYSLFNFKNKLRLLQYSIGSRLVNKTPKGLKSTYEFVRTNKDYQLSKVNQHIVLDWRVNEQPFTIYLPEDSSDALVFQQIFENEEYKTSVEILRSLHEQQLTIIDAGANVGFTSIYLKAFFPTARIFALEPSQSTFRRLEQNVQLNKLSNVTTINKGLWNKTTLLGADLSFRDGKIGHLA